MTLAASKINLIYGPVIDKDKRVHPNNYIQLQNGKDRLNPQNQYIQLQNGKDRLNPEAQSIGNDKQTIEKRQVQDHENNVLTGGTNINPTSDNGQTSKLQTNQNKNIQTAKEGGNAANYPSLEKQGQVKQKAKEGGNAANYPSLEKQGQVKQKAKEGGNAANYPPSLEKQGQVKQKAKEGGNAANYPPSLEKQGQVKQKAKEGGNAANYPSLEKQGQVKQNDKKAQTEEKMQYKKLNLELQQKLYTSEQQKRNLEEKLKKEELANLKNAQIWERKRKEFEEALKKEASQAKTNQSEQKNQLKKNQKQKQELLKTIKDLQCKNKQQEYHHNSIKSQLQHLISSLRKDITQTDNKIHSLQNVIKDFFNILKKHFNEINTIETNSFEPQKTKIVMLLLKNFKTIMAHDEEVGNLVEDKLPIIEKYIQQYLGLVQKDFAPLNQQYHNLFDQQIGLKMKNILQKFNFFRQTLENNQYIAKYQDTLAGKINFFLDNVVLKAIIKCKEAKNYAKMIEQMDKYIKFMINLGEDFRLIKGKCSQAINKIDNEILEHIKIIDDMSAACRQSFDSSKKLYEHSQRFKVLISFTHTVKIIFDCKYFCSNYQRQLRKDIYGLEELIDYQIHSIKASIQSEIYSYEVCCNYYQNHKYLNVLNIIKNFDWLCGKQYNYYHNFKFQDLYKIVEKNNQILIQQKICQINLMINENKVNYQQLKQELSNKDFSSSKEVQNALKNRLKVIITAKFVKIEAISQTTLLTTKHLENFRYVFDDITELKVIVQQNKILQQYLNIDKYFQILKSKLTIIHIFFEFRYNYLHQNIYTPKLEQVQKEIAYLIQFEYFFKEKFPQSHSTFKDNIKNKHQLPDSQIIFSNLTDLLEKRKIILDYIIQKKNMLDEKDYQQIQIYRPSLTLQQQKNIDQKIAIDIQTKLKHLQAAQWEKGQFNSENQLKLRKHIHTLANHAQKQNIEQLQIVKKKAQDQLAQKFKGIKQLVSKNGKQNIDKQLLPNIRKQQAIRPENATKLLQFLYEHLKYLISQEFKEIKQKKQFIKQYIYSFKPQNEHCLKIKSFFAEFQLNTYKNVFEQSGNFAEIEKGLKEERQISQKTWTYMDQLEYAFDLYAFLKIEQKSSVISQQELAGIHKKFEQDKLNKSIKIIRELMNNTDIKLQMNANAKILIVKLVKINYFRNLLSKFPNIKQVKQAESIINKLESVFRQLEGRLQAFSFENMINGNVKESLIIKELQQINEAVTILQSIQQCSSLITSKLNIKMEQINLTKKIKNIEMNWRSLFDKNIKAKMASIFTLYQEVSSKFDFIINLRNYVYDYHLSSFQYITNEEFDIKKIIFAELKKLYQQTLAKVQQLNHKAKQQLALMELRRGQNERNMGNEVFKIRNEYDLMKKQIEKRFQYEDPNDLVKMQLKQAELNQNKQLQQDSIDKIKAQYQKTFNNSKDNWQQMKTNLMDKIIANMAIIEKVGLTFTQQEIKNQIQQYKKALTLYYQKLPIKEEFIERFLNSKIVYIGKLIKENSLFQEMRNETFNKSVQATNDIHYVIQNCEQIKNKKSAQMNELIENYKIYKEQLQRIQNKYKQQRTEGCFNRIIEETKQQAKNISYPLLIARIFAIESIIRIKHKEVLKFVRNPHAAQIVAIFLLISPKKSRGSGDFDNGMVEVKTGEGKSVVLAGLCAFIALKGYQAYCGCYSSYLSERDYRQFRPLFEKMEVLNRVKYGTFADHCKEILNEAGGYTFKQVVKQYLLNGNHKVDKKQKQYLQRLKRKFEKKDTTKRILIIDEVDVFFQDRYIGEVLRPAISVQHETIKMLINFIWSNRQQGKTNKQLLVSRIKESGFFKELINCWKHLENFLNNQIQGMIDAAVNPDHTYQVLNREIVYRYNEVVERQLNSGYKTVFTACSEMQKGRISPQFLDKTQRMSFIISEFSYAELPKYYSNIMGVSGTLETLSKSKKQIMIQRYQIKNFYILPSIYGQSRRIILNPTVIKNNFDQKLMERISQYNKMCRPIVVYFKTQSDLMSFYRFYSAQKKCNLPFLHEDNNSTVQDKIILQAGQSGRITLMTAFFSRGTDFMLQDKEITQGFHVIQTYISKDESDYVQVYGRTARQGKKGSFEMYIKAQLLTDYNITRYDSSSLLDQIKRAWKRKDQQYGTSLTKKIDEAEVVHNNSKRVIQSLLSGSRAIIQEIQRLNYVKPTYKKNVKSVIAIDGTGSMGLVIGKVKDVMQVVVMRSEQIIHAKNIHASFEQQIIIYRNYSSLHNLILQCSGFSNDPRLLSEWIGNVQASGGQGNEAIELVYNKVASMEGVNQLIIIGDAAANTPDQILGKRNYGNPSISYWRDNGIPIVNSAQEELELLIKKQIPIHSFYILTGNSGVEEYFKKVSKKSKGVCEEFLIHDSNAGKKLAAFIAQKVLNQIGGQVLVQQYRMRYG